MLKRLIELIAYNRDWASYIYCKYQKLNPDQLVSFRLRNGQTVAIRADARFILNEIFLDRVYDIAGVDYSTCRSILDIGANMGVYTLYAASRAPQASIYCFEPSSENFSILERNCKTNGIRAKIFQAAVSGSSGVGHLVTDRSSVEYALGEASQMSEQVECFDLKKVFETTGEASFDFVKMDVEGAEREILNNCPDELLVKLKALAIEWHHGWNELELLADRFKSLGFKAQPIKLQGQISYLIANQAKA